MRSLIVAGLLLAAGPVLANDTSAVLTTGGLEFITNQDIVMESEELFISKDEIRAVYQFRNTGAEDQNILVAFPMPDIVMNDDETVGLAFGVACMLHQRYLSLESQRFAEDGG